jgi:hypothetical protein
MHWPCDYRVTWDELYQDAADGFLNELAAEARRTLQAQLRLDTVRDRREAAKLLLSHVDRNRHRTTGPAVSTVDHHVQGLTHEQLRELEAASDDTLGPGTSSGPSEAGGASEPS